VIIHKDFLEEAPESPVHITTKEPQIAADLVQDRILRSDSCVSYADVSNQLFWKVRCYTLNISPFGNKRERGKKQNNKEIN